MKTNIHFSSNDQTWETTQDFYDVINEEFNFTLDPCYTKETAKSSAFYTKEEDGLLKSWQGDTVFINPP